MAYQDENMDLFQEDESEKDEFTAPEIVDDEEEEDDDDDDEEEDEPVLQSEDQPTSSEQMDETQQQPAPTVKQGILAGNYKQKFPIEPDSKLVSSEFYNLVPTTGFIHGCSTFSMAFSWGTKFLFTGGEDGFIRRFSFIDSITGRQPMTMGQRPTFVDTIVNAGVLKGYWENEQPLEEHEYKFDSHNTYLPKLSPVYSLAVHSEALWLAAGLESGGITVQTARYAEGTIQAYLDLHTNAVSELVLSADERFLLSGSWDKTVAYWDLETGQPVRHYTALNGQVSTIQYQPLSGPSISAEDNKSIDSLFGDEDKEDNEDHESEQHPEQENEQKKEGHQNTTFMTSTVNGAIEVWDTRTTERVMQMSGSTAPPWCVAATWSVDGSNIYAGRRNNCVDDFDVRKSSEPLRTLKLPSSSAAVTAVLAMPNGNSLLCASQDNMRLYDLRESNKKTPFHIVPSHHGVCISRLLMDPTCHYLLAASGGRGWSEGPTSDMILSYEVDRA